MMIIFITYFIHINISSFSGKIILVLSSGWGLLQFLHLCPFLRAVPVKGAALRLVEPLYDVGVLVWSPLHLFLLLIRRTALFSLEFLVVGVLFHLIG